MKMAIGKTYLVKKDIFGLKKDELWTLVDKGYQAYFGEHNFVFVNDEKVKVFAVLQDSSEEEMQIYHHLDDYFVELTHKNFQRMWVANWKCLLLIQLRPNESILS